MDEHFTEMKTRLQKITENCSEDMHEPDNAGVSAKIIGFKLDNACGDQIIPDAIVDGWQEYVVIIDNNGKKETFNLSSLIALARM